MNEHVYKHLEMTGSSTTSIEDAINNCLATAAQTVRNMRWMKVVETRGHIENDQVKHWQVVIKVGFTVDSDAR